MVLLVLADGIHTNVRLPAVGHLTIGRSAENDLQIDDASISKRHAVLHVGPPLTIEDAGSSNGTILRGVRRESLETGRMLETRLRPGQQATIGLGDLVSLGSVVLTVQPADTPRAAAPARPAATAPAPSFVVLDAEMVKVHELGVRVAAGDISVLLLGETGVGKDVLAEAIHRASPRAGKPLLRLNCAALSELLLESELFGYEKGAFTGALSAKPGLLETAQGGSVFLDEVGELPPAIQAKLLRVLEERQVMPVGSLRPRPIDVRFISATNRDLEAEVAAGRFRQDLYFRLDGVALVVPPLRERRAEIEPLARMFLEQVCARLKVKAPAISPEALAVMKAHDWPGNVRELKNLIDRVVLLCGAGPITLEHLPTERMGVAPAAPAAAGSAPDLRAEVAALERQRILDALEKCAGNQTQAAKVLGMPRRTLVKRLTAYDIPRPRKR
jgi:two-component system, NtrC family, response regulator AtoC